MFFYYCFIFTDEDDCGNGAEHFSYHFDRTDPECRSYYRCNNAGSVLSTASCPEDQMYNPSNSACESNSLFACYVG